MIGLIAQEVQRVLPEVVNEDPETGILSVSYTEIIPVLIEAFKQHVREYEIEKKGVHQQLEGMRSRLERLEKSKYTLLSSSLPLLCLLLSPLPSPLPVSSALLSLFT